MMAWLPKKLVWTAVALIAAAAGAWAQQPSPAPAYRIQGTIKGLDGTPVADADVGVVENDSTAHTTRSDSIGRFDVEGITAARVTLHVRRLGFQPQELTVNVTKAGRTARVDVTLEPTVASLDAVVVDERAPVDRGNPRLVGFKERVGSNSFGHYVTEEMLAKLRPQHASDAVRMLPGVTVRPGRIGSIVRLRGCGNRGISSERVGPLVWLDGVRLPGAEIDEVTQGGDIAAIEVYNSFAGVPVQFLDRTAICGTILVWTKHR